MCFHLKAVTLQLRNSFFLTDFLDLQYCFASTKLCQAIWKVSSVRRQIKTRQQVILLIDLTELNQYFDFLCSVTHSEISVVLNVLRTQLQNLLLHFHSVPMFLSASFTWSSSQKIKQLVWFSECINSGIFPSPLPRPAHTHLGDIKREHMGTG